MKVSVVIPTLNEEKTIASVVEGVPKKFPVYVIDAKSSDKTVEIAKNCGAKVLSQEGRGKGNALRQAFSSIKADIYVVIDGDATYNPKEIPKLIKPIVEKEADMVIGSRMIKGRKSISSLNLFGNILFNFIIKLLLGKKITDMLSGFRAVEKKVVKNLKISSNGFEVESEITIKALKKGYRIKEVPVSYRRRVLPSKLHPIKDGMKIFLAMMKFIVMKDEA